MNSAARGRRSTGDRTGKRGGRHSTPASERRGERRFLHTLATDELEAEMESRSRVTGRGRGAPGLPNPDLHRALPCATSPPDLCSWAPGGDGGGSRSQGRPGEVGPDGARDSAQGESSGCQVPAGRGVQLVPTSMVSGSRGGEEAGVFAAHSCWGRARGATRACWLRDLELATSSVRSSPGPRLRPGHLGKAQESGVGRNFQPSPQG